MRLVASDFNALLNTVGQDFLWRSARACPCLNPHSGQPKPSCPHCSGKGRIWAAAIAGKSGVLSRSQQKKMAGFGMWDDGDIMLSIPSNSPLYDMGIYDRVQAVNRTEPFSQVLIYGINDTLKFEPVQMDSVIWLDADNNLINGTPPYVVDGVLVWHGTTPPAKTSYTVTGRRLPEYYCYQDLPLDRPHEFGEALPRRVVLRRFELWGM